MAKHPPVYHLSDATVTADTCAPLNEAVSEGQVGFRAWARGHYPGERLARGMLPGLKSIGFWDASGPQHWGLDWHRNEGIEITFLETGALPFAVDGQDWPLHAGEMSITRPWQSHAVGDPYVHSGRLIWVIVDVGVRRPDQAWRWPSWLMLSKRDLERLTQLLRHTEQPVWPAASALRQCFAAIDKVLTNTVVPREAESRLTLHLNELFLTLLEMLEARHIPLNPSLSSTRRMVAFFLDSLGQSEESLNMPWTVETMARQCDLGVTAFTRYCKELKNCTPIEFLNRQRLEYAAQRLCVEPDTSITDIALRCGFQSSQYFATQFKKHQGCTPKVYREAGSEKV